MNFKSIIVFLILILSISCSTKKKAIVVDKVLENAINCFLELNQNDFLVGDELTLYFVVENNSEQKIYIDNSPYGGYYINGKRKGGFGIKIEDEDGHIIEQIHGMDMRSGRFGITQIDPKEKLKIRIHDIFKYGITNREGSYSISIDKKLLVYMNQKKGTENAMISSRNFEKCIQMIKKEFINVKVSNR